MGEVGGGGRGRGGRGAGEGEGDGEETSIAPSGERDWEARCEGGGVEEEEEAT